MFIEMGKKNESNGGDEYEFKLFENLNYLDEIFDSGHLQIDENESEDKENFIDFVQMNKKNERKGKENKGIKKKLVAKNKSNSKSILKENNASTSVRKHGQVQTFKKSQISSRKFINRVKPSKSLKALNVGNIVNSDKTVEPIIEKIRPLSSVKSLKSFKPSDLNITNLTKSVVPEIKEQVSVKSECQEVLITSDDLNDMKLTEFEGPHTKELYPLGLPFTTDAAGNCNQPEDQYNIDLSDIVGPHIENLMALELLNDALRLTVLNSTDDTEIVTPLESQTKRNKDDDVIRMAFEAINKLTPMEYPLPE